MDGSRPPETHQAEKRGVQERAGGQDVHRPAMDQGAVSGGGGGAKGGRDQR